MWLSHWWSPIVTHRVLSTGPLTHQSRVTPGLSTAGAGPTSADTNGFNRFYNPQIRTLGYFSLGSSISLKNEHAASWKQYFHKVRKLAKVWKSEQNDWKLRSKLTIAKKYHRVAQSGQHRKTCQSIASPLQYDTTATTRCNSRSAVNCGKSPIGKLWQLGNARCIYITSMAHLGEQSEPGEVPDHSRTCRATLYFRLYWLIPSNPSIFRLNKYQSKLS